MFTTRTDSSVQFLSRLCKRALTILSKLFTILRQLVSLFVRALTRKRLKLPTSNLVHVYSIAVARHALTQKSKGQRLRSRGYQNSHGCTVASDAFYNGLCWCGYACRFDCLCFLVTLWGWEGNHRTGHTLQTCTGLELTGSLVASKTASYLQNCCPRLEVHLVFLQELCTQADSIRGRTRLRCAFSSCIQLPKVQTS